MTPDEAVAAARFTLKRGLPVPAGIVGVLLAELDARGVAIERVRELHVQSGSDLYPGEAMPWCASCGGGSWPCETIRALDGRP